MNIRPMNDTATLKLNISEIQTRTLATPKIAIDKSGVIPNGIYKVIRWEKFRQRFTMIFSALLLTAMIILISLYATVFESKWVSYIIPVIVGVGSAWKLLATSLEFKWLRKSIETYKEDIRIGLTSTPPFISRLYLSLHKKQVAHNWLTFALLFYGGIFTLLLWWLKDVSWWIFEFKTWIHSLFANPTLMMWLFTSALLLIAVMHIVFAIQRKSRILDINAYFGQGIIPESEIETIKQAKNKMYRRLFIVSVMILLIIPLVVKLILKLVRLKK